jgi:hypothetical protein
VNKAMIPSLFRDDFRAPVIGRPVPPVPSLFRPHISDATQIRVSYFVLLKNRVVFDSSQGRDFGLSVSEHEAT